MTPREKQIIELISRDPFISQQELAARLGIGRSAVAGHIMRLTGRGVIQGRGYLLARGRKIVCIGAANLDLLGTPGGPLDERRSTPGHIRRAAGGAARNVAENLVRRGLEASLVTVVGRDPAGEFLLEQAQSVGIDTTLAHESTTGRTSTYMAILDESGDTRLAINDMEILAEMRSDHVDRAIALADPGLPLVVDSNLLAATLERIAANPAVGPLFVDSVSPAKAPRITAILGNIHTLKTSLDDVRALADAPLRDSRAAAAWLRDRGVKRVFVTRGAHGVSYAHADAADGTRRPRGKSKVVSTSGAGDAFLAGLVFAYVDGLDFDASLDVAIDWSAETLADAGNVASSARPGANAA